MDFVQINWQAGIVGDLDPTFREYLEMIVTFFCRKGMVLDAETIVNLINKSYLQ